MKRKIIKPLLAICAAFFLAFLPITSTFAECSPGVCDEKNNYPESVKAACGCSNATDSPGIESVIINILNAVIAISGLVAAVFVIIGGIQYMTSSGDAGKVKKAKDTILYALIGIAVCALAYAIVNWAISAIDNSSASAEETAAPESNGTNNKPSSNNTPTNK